MPPLLKQITGKVAQKYTSNVRLTNLFKTTYKKNVLISHTVFPFIFPHSYRHSYFLEIRLIAEVFREMQFNIDVVNYLDHRTVDYKKYSVLFGFGFPIIKYYRRSNSKVRVIAYNAGMHNYFQNQATINRLLDFYQTHGVWLMESGRYVENDWTGITRITDAVVTLGDDVVKSSYEKYTDKPVYTLPVPGFFVLNYLDLIDQKLSPEWQNNYLWFGGKGLIHKGLDLLLDYFGENPEIHLYVCGPIEDEEGFCSLYHELLYRTENIHTQGFIKLETDSFNKILQKCTFVIFPSCSEGGGASVVNVCANGGLIPIVSKESSVYTGDFGIEIPTLNYKGINKAIQSTRNIGIDEIRARMKRCGDYFTLVHSPENFRNAFMKTISIIMEN